MNHRTPRILAACCGVALSAIALGDKTSLTIYSTAAPGAIPAEMYRPLPASRSAHGYGYRPFLQAPGYAVVRQDRSMALAQGRSSVSFTDVASMIDPTTVSFASLSDPSGTRVIEQSYQFDLVSPDKLLERFVDQTIGVTIYHGDTTQSLSGRLLSSAPGQLVLSTDAGIRVVTGYSGLTLPTLPEGLITRPTLKWDVNAQRAGAHDVRVSYQTQGVTWWADYNLIFAPGDDENTGTLEVASWVSILNQSGASYENATLKLVAGNVHRAPTPSHGMQERWAAAVPATVSGDAGFEEKSFFEYHLYTLGRPISIADNSTRQIELFDSARRVPCEKILVYDGAGEMYWGSAGPALDQGFGVQTKPDVDVYLRFQNTKEAGLGIPLPAGRIRVSKLDKADDTLEFIGEDVIRHTPREEPVLVRMGKAFDVVGERRQVDFRVDRSRREIVETIEVKVRNRKNERVRVVAQERMNRWGMWEILKSSVAGKKLDATLMHFPLVLNPDEEGVVTYTVRYTW